MNILLYAILGLGAGAVYGLLAQGIVAIYRSSGVLNFAQGAIAMTSAYLFVDLRANHSAWISLVVVVAGSAVFGALVHLLVMSPMRNASSLARVCATLGIFISLQSAVSLHYGTKGQVVTGFLPSNSVSLWDGAAIGADRLILVGIGVAVTTVLWFVYRFSQFGRLTTGVWRNSDAVSALGGSPRTVAVANWAIGCALAGLCGCLIVPLTGLQISALSMLVVPALAAAIAGKFSSFPAALVAGLLIGVAESVVSKYISTPGWTQAVPLLVIVVLFISQGHSLPVRGETQERLPSVGRARYGKTGVMVFSAALALAAILGPVAWAGPITSTALIAIAGLSVVTVTGYAGQLNLAPYALAGIAGLAGANAAASWGWSLLPCLLIGAAVSVPMGVLVSLAAVRTRGANLAAVTLALGVVVQDTVFNNSTLTGGMTGLVTGPLTVFGWSIDTTLHANRYAVVVCIVLALAGLLVVHIRQGASGRRMLAVRDNERAAAAVGISVWSAKVFAFAISTFIVSLFGVLTSLRSGIATFTNFEAFASVLLIGSVVLCGIGYVGGAMIAGVVAAGGLVTSWLGFTDLETYLPLIGGLALIITLVLQPSGIVPEVLQSTDRLVGAVRRLLPGSADLSNQAGAIVLKEAALTAHADAVVVKVVPRELRVEKLSVEYGKTRAVDELSLHISPGEILGLIGPNGAGKTSAIDAISGFASASGDVTLGDVEVTKLPPSRRSSAGLGRSFQSVDLFDDLTIGENVMVGDEGAGMSGFLQDFVRPPRNRLSETARSAVDLFGLEPYLDAMPEEVPFAVRRLTGIARAVSNAPSVVLLDEPAAGLGSQEVQELMVLLRRLSEDWGMAILLVEHHMELVMSVCDRIQVLELGRTIAIGTPQEIQDDNQVRMAYLGGPSDQELVDSPQPVQA